MFFSKVEAREGIFSLVGERHAQLSSDLNFGLLGEGLGQHCFLGGFPAVLNERLPGDCGFGPEGPQKKLGCAPLSAREPKLFH